MLRRIRALVALGGLIGLALVLAPAAAAGDPCYHTYTIPPSTTGATSTVKLDPCAFLPTNAQVAPGSTVTFTNDSGFPHLLTGANAEWGDRDREIPDGGSTSVRFDEPGIYAYSCSLHRGMSGAIIVGNPSDADTAAAASTAPNTSPDGLVPAVAIAGLAVLAAAGWGLALLQRRRSPHLVSVTAERPLSG